MRCLWGILACGLVFADESTPNKKAPACDAPSPAIVREIDRLLASAAEHATLSHTCIDGNGERTTITRLAACVQRPVGRPNVDVIGLQVQVRYQATVTEERGRCQPLPDCAKRPPPSERTASVELAFSASPDGFELFVPRELPEVPLKTPLDKKHSTGCYGESPAFVPRKIKP